MGVTFPSASVPKEVEKTLEQRIAILEEDFAYLKKHNSSLFLSNEEPVEESKEKSDKGPNKDGVITGD